MRQSSYLADAFETQLGLGARIGEVLALTVADLDLDQEQPLVNISATLITPNGGTLSRQPHTKKGAGGRRVVVVPAWVADILRNRALRFRSERAAVRHRYALWCRPTTRESRGETSATGTVSDGSHRTTCARLRRRP